MIDRKYPAECRRHGKTMRYICDDRCVECERERRKSENYMEAKREYMRHYMRAYREKAV